MHLSIDPQSGSSANHDMQVHWKTNASNTWDAAKSTNIVNYVAQNNWHDVYLGLNGLWTGQTINQIRLDFDQANTGTRWIVDLVEVVNIVQPPYNFDANAQGFAAGNAITGFTWTNCCGWPGIIYGDQVGDDAYYFGPRSYFGGGSGDWIKVRVFPQAGNTANHDMQIHWATTAEPGFTASKASPTVTYVAQDSWADVYLQVGNNALWAGKTIIQLRVDFDQTNHGNRWIVDSVQISGPPPTPPTAPSGLTATAINNSQINLAWTDNSNNESNFVVKRSNTSGGPYTNIATLGANVTSYSNTGLAGNTTYYYVVEATGSGGNSGNSNQASATTLNNPPAAPSGLGASSPNTTQINLTWADNSSDETNFVVARSSTSGGPYTDIATLGANVTSYSNTGLTANTTYYYVVRATNAAGASANSNQASATTWPNEIVIDNTGTFTASTNWSTGTSSADKFGADYRFRPTAAISDQAVWNATIPQTRNYQVFAWWTQGANRAAAAAYTMPDNTTVSVNQQTGGGAWNSLGVRNVAAGAATVKLSCWTTTGFVVVADATRLVPQ
jgi:Fibronectin type III domain